MSDHGSRSLRWVDVLAVAYLVGAGVLLMPGGTSGWIYPFCIGLHGFAAAGIVALARADSLPPFLRAVRDLYPVVLLMVLYGEADLLVQMVHDPPGFEGIVRQWDRGLFGIHLHRHFYHWLSGPGWQELFHLLYLSYYLLVFGTFFALWKRRPTELPRFSFVVVGMFVSFIAIFVAVPVAGPLASPEVSLMTTGVFPSIVAWLYVPLTVDGIHTGAFPSSHVGMSVGIVLLLAPRRWWTRIALGGLVLGIAISTVYGRFHYAIDAVAGLAMGFVLYVLWTWMYGVLSRTSTPVVETDRKIDTASASTFGVADER